MKVSTVASWAAVALVTVAISWTTQALPSAQQPAAQDKAVVSALHRIETNCKAVRTYARIYEWDNVDNEVDRIVAAEKAVHKAYASQAEKQSQSAELASAVKTLRAARFAQDASRAVAAAEKVQTAAHALLK